MALTASFLVGAFANQIVVQQIQSLAGNHVLVPAPELQIISTTWNINGNLSLITGVTLNVTTVSTGSNATKLYVIFVQVSCLDLTTGKEFTCSTGSGTITLPVNLNGRSATLTVTLTPQIDPETVEVHDLSFIVTGSPSGTPPPPTPCDSTFTVSATPSSVTINRTVTNVAIVTKTFFYPKNANPCPQILISLNAKSSPPGLNVALTTNNVILLPGQAFTVTEAISATSSTAPGQYSVIETDTSPPITQTVVTQVFVF
jgi:hypothetical protein